MATQENELSLSGSLEAVGDNLLDAIELVAAHDQKVWLLDATGKRIAAIVPVEKAERDERWLEGVLRSPAGPCRSS